MSYFFLEHTADVKFEARGETVEEAFVSSVDALNEVIRGDIKILELGKKEIEVSGHDFASLIYNFLEEFLFLLDGEGFLVSRISKLEIDKEKFSLKAEVVGDLAINYKFTNDVKAITYNEIFAGFEEKDFVVRVVLDV